MTGVEEKLPESPTGREGKESAVEPENPPALVTERVMGSRLPGAHVDWERFVPLSTIPGVPHESYLNFPIRVAHVPFASACSLVYQKVQSSTGSTVMSL